MATDDFDELLRPHKRLQTWLVVVVVVLVAGAVAFVLVRAGDEASAESRGHRAAVPRSDDAPGPMVELQPFVVNLVDDERARYLMVGLSLELRDEAAKARYDARRIQARHAILMTLSSLAYAETRDVDDRNRLRKRLHDQLEEVVGTRNIKAVFFTDFVTQ